MALTLPLGSQALPHLSPGTYIKALITSVHDRYLLKFTMRIVNMSEFELTDIIELSNHTFLGYSVPLPPEGMFGLGINNKIYRAILMKSIYTPMHTPSAYLVDVGIVMPIQPWDPIYSLSPVVQSIPGTAIACIYAEFVDPFKQIERWRFVQEHLREDLVVILKVVCRIDSVLQVLFADDHFYNCGVKAEKQEQQLPFAAMYGRSAPVNEYYT